MIDKKVQRDGVEWQSGGVWVGGAKGGVSECGSECESVGRRLGRGFELVGGVEWQSEGFRRNGGEEVGGVKGVIGVLMWGGV